MKFLNKHQVGIHLLITIVYIILVNSNITQKSYTTLHDIVDKYFSTL